MDIGPDLRSNDYNKNEWSDDKSKELDGATKQKEASMFEDLVVAARGGMEKLRPALQRVYMTTASAYGDEGIKKVSKKSWKRRTFPNLNKKRTLKRSRVDHVQSRNFVQEEVDVDPSAAHQAESSLIIEERKIFFGICKYCTRARLI